MFSSWLEVKRIRILREVTKEGEYTRHYGVKRLDWSVDLPGTYRALCISIGTRDIIIAYRCLRRMRKGGTIEKRSVRAQKKLNRRGYGRFSCKKYGGICPADNFCPGLRNPRGGDFGWGECIHGGIVGGD